MAELVRHAGRDDRLHVEPRSAATIPGARSAARWRPRWSSRASGSALRGAVRARAADDAGGHPDGGRGRKPGLGQLELKALEEQTERLARAELRALRAQISPHFIYNALAAIAGYIHSKPEEARELLTEFAEFTRYAFRGQRPYVTLADELDYVEKYLRLERARFGDRLQVRLQVAPEVLQTVVPVLACSLWSRMPSATASSGAARGGSRSSAATPAPTWR